MKGELHMKIVVIKSPKVLSGVLRLIFGIKSEKQ
ncbi:MAG TPA: stage V sporulation protein SpoVM [Ruminococcus sp.]|nr:stage V sporulation protein SpoVM [Ruminococcus sp.]